MQNKKSAELAAITSISTAEVQAIYDKAYTTPGLMGTHLDGE